MLILQWEYWVGSCIALALGLALGRLWCSRALAGAEEDLLALEEVLRDRMAVDRQIREALGLGDIGSTIEAVRHLTTDRAVLRKRAEDAEYRLEHPPLAQNQDDLARICYEAYMGYTSSDSLAEEPWSEVDAWEAYGWRLAANAVRNAEKPKGEEDGLTTENTKDTENGEALLVAEFDVRAALIAERRAHG